MSSNAYAVAFHDFMIFRFPDGSLDPIAVPRRISDAGNGADVMESGATLVGSWIALYSRTVA